MSNKCYPYKSQLNSHVADINVNNVQYNRVFFFLGGSPMIDCTLRVDYYVRFCLIQCDYKIARTQVHNIIVVIFDISLFGKARVIHTRSHAYSHVRNLDLLIFRTIFFFHFSYSWTGEKSRFPLTPLLRKRMNVYFLMYPCGLWECFFFARRCYDRNFKPIYCYDIGIQYTAPLKCIGTIHDSRSHTHTYIDVYNIIIHP